MLEPKESATPCFGAKVIAVVLITVGVDSFKVVVSSNSGMCTDLTSCNFCLVASKFKNI